MISSVKEERSKDKNDSFPFLGVLKEGRSAGSVVLFSKSFFISIFASLCI